MLHIVLFSVLVLLVAHSEAGRSHYYGGPGYPIVTSGYNNYYDYVPYQKHYGYGADGYGADGHGYGAYDGYNDYDGYGDDVYDVDNYGGGSYKGSYGGYEGYSPYAYRKQVIPTKYIHSPVIKEYVEPLPVISKSVSTLYQTHPSPYDSHGGGGYAGGYGYAPKYGNQYADTYYKK